MVYKLLAFYYSKLNDLYFNILWLVHDILQYFSIHLKNYFLLYFIFNTNSQLSNIPLIFYVLYFILPIPPFFLKSKFLKKNFIYLNFLIIKIIMIEV